MAMAARLLRLRATEVSIWLMIPTPIASSPVLPSRSFLFSDFSFSGRREGGILWPGWSPWVTACMCAAAESVRLASGGAGGGTA